jgi:hypothetical protein
VTSMVFLSWAAGERFGSVGPDGPVSRS